MADEELNKLYAVVVFPPDMGEDDETVNIVPQSWVISERKTCVWPRKYSKLEILKCLPPPKKCHWPEYGYIQIRENIEGYEKAAVIERNLLKMKEDNLSVESDLPSKRASKPSSRFSPTLADVESDGDSPIRRRRLSRNCLHTPSPESKSQTERVSLSPNFPSPPGSSKRNNVSKNLSFDRTKQKRTKTSENVATAPDPPQNIPDASISKPSDPPQNIPDASISKPSTSENLNVRQPNPNVPPAQSGGPHTSDASNPVPPTGNLNTAHSKAPQNIPDGSNVNAQSNTVLQLQQFKTKYSQWTEEQRNYFIAESLFLVRKTLPGLVTQHTQTHRPMTKSDPLKGDVEFKYFPINSKDDLIKAEALLRKKGFKDRLMVALKKRQCRDINSSASKMCSTIFTDNFGKDYSMIGQRDKKAFLPLPFCTLISGSRHTQALKTQGAVTLASFLTVSFVFVVTVQLLPRVKLN